METNQIRPFTPGQLRRIRLFANMTEEQIGHFIALVEPLQVNANQIVIRKGGPGDCMFLLLDGEVRVSEYVENRETILAKLETGDFFGEVALVDEGLRSADVVANRDCRLLKISQGAFRDIVQRHPDVAAQFLLAMLRAVAGRVRQLDKKQVDSMLLARFWHRGTPPAQPR